MAKTVHVGVVKKTKWQKQWHCRGLTSLWPIGRRGRVGLVLTHGTFGVWEPANSDLGQGRLYMQWFGLESGAKQMNKEAWLHAPTSGTPFRMFTG